MARYTGHGSLGHQAHPGVKSVGAWNGSVWIGLLSSVSFSASRRRHPEAKARRSCGTVDDHRNFVAVGGDDE